MAGLNIQLGQRGEFEYALYAPNHELNVRNIYETVAANVGPQTRTPRTGRGKERTAFRADVVLGRGDDIRTTDEHRSEGHTSELQSH